VGEEKGRRKILGKGKRKKGKRKNTGDPGDFLPFSLNVQEEKTGGRGGKGTLGEKKGGGKREGGRKGEGKCPWAADPSR